MPGLCDVLGITDDGVVIGHWEYPQDANGTVVALDVVAADPPLESQLGPARPDAADFGAPSLRRVVSLAGAPEDVTFATDLLGQALEPDGGES